MKLMKKKQGLFVILSFVLLLGLAVGCSTDAEDQTQPSNHEDNEHGSNDQHETNPDQMPGVVNVSIILYESPVVGRELHVDARVTQDDEAVEDAQEVLFEIGKVDQDKAEDKQHDMTQLPSDTAAEGSATIEQDTIYVKAEHIGKGVYRIKATFAEEGDYYVIGHVTARNMHVMPKYEFNVTSP